MKKNLNVAFQMDPFESLNLKGDTTFALALEAQKRNFHLSHYTPSDLLFKSGKLYANLKTISLNIENNNVKDISVLSPLRSLSWIDLGNNQVSNIEDLSTLKTLSSLNISKNEISNIDPLSKATNLAWLSIANNQIRDLSPLNSLPKLRHLVIEGNAFNQQTRRIHIPRFKSRGITVIV